ncbi:MAG: alkyl sulfatase C-terminal domain-containing protein [Promethearchaeota archaeon]
MTKKEEFLEKVESDTLKGDDILLLLDVFEEMSKENEDVIELLEDLKDEGENIVLNFIIEDINATLIINDGKLVTKHELSPNPTLTIKMDKNTALKVLSGKLSMMDAYKEGKIVTEGELIKVAALGILLNIIGDELGIL